MYRVSAFLYKSLNRPHKSQVNCIEQFLNYTIIDEIADTFKMQIATFLTPIRTFKTYKVQAIYAYNKYTFAVRELWCDKSTVQAAQNLKNIDPFDFFNIFYS